MDLKGRDLYVAKTKARMVEEGSAMVGQVITADGLFGFIAEFMAKEIHSMAVHVKTDCPSCGARGVDHAGLCVYCGA